MEEFDPRRGFSEFSYFVKVRARHILDNRCKRFLSSVIESAERRATWAERGAILWRAQLAVEWEKKMIGESTGCMLDSYEVPMPAKRERMIPLLDRACEGRVNPKGIPCLYLSTEKNTAMAEVRPWIGSYISVAQFVILRDLRLIDCSSDAKKEFGFLEVIQSREVAPDRLERQVWYDINQAFAEPVTRTDDVADYAPTQILAEAFRDAGFEGIIYGSRLGSGKTVAIFDVFSADLINCELHRVESVEFKCGEVASYISEKYYDKSGKFRFPQKHNESGGI